MKRKRLTEYFPWILPVRTAQRKAFFYTRMALDRRTYAKTIQESTLLNKVTETSSLLYNANTGSGMKYQHNKVFNLKLAAQTLDGLLIQPNETFSFWQCVRHADKHTSFKEGLIVTNGNLTTTIGGGMCQMSNLLFFLLLHSPLQIEERSTHNVKRFPDPTPETLKGVDATVNEGWIDLKVSNPTDETFQIRIEFDEEHIYAKLLSSHSQTVRYTITTENVIYYEKDNHILERVSVYRQTVDRQTNQTQSKEKLYDNCCIIGYELPEGTEIIKTPRERGI
ncbi:MAG: glycopeptide resistance accessory protein VanW [Bacilli bacterium]